MFDSSLLKEKINSLIASGKRNFAIDMSPLDYIYSDTINVLMAMNKRVLDVTGRLTLMAPQPEVMQILKRAGIHNILRIFESETELIKSSEDIILQTTSYKLSDIKAAAKEPQPQSEFDQLRSEISSAFGTAEAVQAGSDLQTPVQGGRVGTEEEFNQMFQQFEKGPQVSGRSPSYGVPPMSPPIIQPQPPKFQPRQFQQPTPQPIPFRPAAPSYPPRQPVESPKTPPDYSSVRSETQRFTSAPGNVQFQEPAAAEFGGGRESFSEEATLDAVSKGKSVKTKTFRRKDVASFEEEDLQEDEFKKKSPVPVLIIVLVLLGLGGAVAFILYSTTVKKKTQTVVSNIQPKTPPQVTSTPTPPQIPVGTEVQKAAVDSGEASKGANEIVESKPEVETAKPLVRKTPPKPSIRKSTSSYSRADEPREEPREEPPRVNQVVFTSSPSGATISINGQTMGITPYTWTKPFFGKVSVQISKPGYQTAQKTFEFTGGSMRESFTLEKALASVPPPPEPADRVVPQKQETRELVQTAPRRASTQTTTAAEEEEDLFEDIGEEVSPPESSPSSSGSQAMTQPRSTPSETQARTPVTSSRPTPPSAGGGGEALIFIASIPPVADVFLNDQLIGKTNVSELKIPAGVQTLKFVKGPKEITKQFNLQPGKNPSQMVRIP